MMRERALEWH